MGRARRHNRMLHGWGVGCGLAVAVTPSPVDGEPEPWSVTVSAGYALTGCGDEVCVPGDVRVDIRSPHPDGADVCAPPVDPWCAPVRERRDPERTYYLAIRYAEQQTRPVRATACGCGCDDDPCEYSRVAEGYALAVLDELPECYQPHVRRQRDGGEEDERLARREAIGCSPRIEQTGTRPCPDCCSPWVVLADLRVDTGGTVTVDALSHRRFLASFGRFGFTCAPRPDTAPTVTITHPESGATFPAGHQTPVQFEASASDPEDGDLTGGSVQWFDSHHGAQHQSLGEGTSLSTTLSWDVEDRPTARTQHTILVEATDSDGNVATDSTRVSVGEPEPLPPPPRIVATSPANGEVLPEGSVRSTFELSFDREMDGALLNTPDSWLRAWAIFPEDIFRDTTTIARLELAPLGSGNRKLARYDFGPDDKWHSFLYLVQVRPGSSITDDAQSPQVLDGDFLGTKVPQPILDEIWSMAGGVEHHRPKGWVDKFTTWTPTQDSLPSGDGQPGGLFHMLFYIQAPIN